MNIQFLQAAVAQPQTNNVAANVGTSTHQTFGSVFAQLSHQPSKEQIGAEGSQLLHEVDQILQVQDSKELLQAEFITIEQLLAALKEDVEGLASFLQTLGFNLPEEWPVESEKSYWLMMQFIEEHAPMVFGRLQDALATTTSHEMIFPKDTILSVITVLKASQLAANQVDLTTTQEHQLFTVQQFLTPMTEFVTVEVMKQSTTSSTLPFMQATAPTLVITGEAPNHHSNDQSSKEQAMPQFSIHSVTNHEGRLQQEPTLPNARSEALMREMQAIMQRSNFGQTGGTNRLLIKLYPEHLGQVRIELLQQNGVMTARILASTALGKEMLDSQLHQLRAAFLQQNLQVERIDVSQTLQDLSKQDRENAFAEQFKRGQAEEQQEATEDSEEEQSFQEYLIELEG